MKRSSLALIIFVVVVVIVDWITDQPKCCLSETNEIETLKMSRTLLGILLVDRSFSVISLHICLLLCVFFFERLERNLRFLCSSIYETEKGFLNAQMHTSTTFLNKSKIHEWFRGYSHKHTLRTCLWLKEFIIVIFFFLSVALLSLINFYETWRFFSPEHIVDHTCASLARWIAIHTLFRWIYREFT